MLLGSPYLGNSSEQMFGMGGKASSKALRGNHGHRAGRMGLDSLDQAQHMGRDC
jgi:hypothetical protein